MQQHDRHASFGQYLVNFSPLLSPPRLHKSFLLPNTWFRRALFSFISFLIHQIVIISSKAMWLQSIPHPHSLLRARLRVEVRSASKYLIPCPMPISFALKSFFLSISLHLESAFAQSAEYFESKTLPRRLLIHKKHNLRVTSVFTADRTIPPLRCCHQQPPMSQMLFAHLHRSGCSRNLPRRGISTSLVVHPPGVLSR